MKHALGRSHRSPYLKKRLSHAIDKSTRLLGIPEDWICGIVPGSGTGACSLALHGLLGPKPVDILVSDGFSRHWAREVANLRLAPPGNIVSAPIGTMPDIEKTVHAHDLILVLNGTNSGVAIRSLDRVSSSREGLVICDGTSAAFAMPIDFSKIDAFCWSWQKALGGEGGHGMIALSPNAVTRLESVAAKRKLPKLLNVLKADGSIHNAFFDGHTISTPSGFAIEDFHSALDWAVKSGGVTELISRVERNYQAVARWVEKTPWIEWLCTAPEYRSRCSLCLRFSTTNSIAHTLMQQKHLENQMIARLAENDAGYDLWSYGDAPPGFRIWGGPTVETPDLEHLCTWLTWAYETEKAKIGGMGPSFDCQ